MKRKTPVLRLTLQTINSVHGGTSDRPDRGDRFAQLVFSKHMVPSEAELFQISP